ncbi:glycosyltransferase [Halomonas saccharevitans]|uniref:Glycosyltransferase involved in cell wall bisynthesis n=1 Tax=Halomonas saccharevitans TaxID=416872 RepID=A0A1I7B385_9GAMM|nr:glycosyltransferase [Halomonas saccharevitans]SFT81659.1 Glycosyltransferase involved in cell wall bisynthesis [Halomonas saccharevitans]
MPHVLLVIDQLASGGAPRSVLKLTRALLESHIRVSLISLSDRVGLPIPEGAECHVVAFTPSTRWEKLHRYKIHARRLDDFLSSHMTPLDLVVSNLHQAHQVVSRSSLAKQAWYCLRSDPWQELLSNKRGWRRQLKRHKVRRLYDNKRIIALSRTNLESLDRIGSQPDATRVIPNVLEVERIHKLMEESVAEPALQDTGFCLFVGRLNFRQKRLDRLLEGYLASGIELPLVLIGDGESKRLQQEVTRLDLQDRVWALGSRDNPYPYMKRASALLLSSDYEGLPNVLLESLACGTPVVSTDCLSGPRDILVGDLARGLVPLEDTEAFGKAIRDVIDHSPSIEPNHISPYMPETVSAAYHELIGEGPCKRHSGF